MPKKPSPIFGRYRIIEMPDFDEEYVDAEEKAFIQFDPDESGEFHFGLVHGGIDCRKTERDGKPAVEWTWDGNDEHHPAMGRGWAVLQGDGMLEGRIFFHGSDDHAFRAKKWPGGKVKRKMPPVMFVFKGRKVKRLKMRK
jgi:hypothetical protein